MCKKFLIMHFIILAFFIIYGINKLFYDDFNFDEAGMNMTGIPPQLTLGAKSYMTSLYINADFNNADIEIRDFTKIINIQYVVINLGILLLFLLMYFKYKLYCKKNKKRCRKNRHSKLGRGSTARNRNSKIKCKKMISQIFLLITFKCLVMAIIYLAIKQKHSPIVVRHKTFSKGYFLSIEYFGDSYEYHKLQTKSLFEWYAMSKLKFKSYKSFFQLLIMLSGDVAINPGPNRNPTVTNPNHTVASESSTSTNVATLVEGGEDHDLLNIDQTQLENSALPFSEFAQPENEQSFLVQEEQLQNVSLADEAQWFKKKGLHFVHLNCNSLLHKIEEIREFVLQCKPHVMCFSESKTDSTITNEEIKLDEYTHIRRDRTRNGGGVACYVRKGVDYNERTDFSNDFENIFIDILLPKTTPILFGVVYRPQTTLNFDELLAKSILDANSFDKQEVYIMGDTNYNLLDRKMNFILKKGYRFSKDLTNYTTPLYLVKKYIALMKTFGLKQLIEEPTRTTDKTSTLLDHILVNTPSKVTQSGVISKGISDHDIIFMTRKHENAKTGQHNTISIRSMKNYTKELLIQKLGEIQFPDYSSFVNINDAYHDFITKLLNIIDKLAPFKQVRVKSNSKPWFDGETLESIRVRDKLRKKYKKSGLKTDFDNFKNAQKQAKQNIKQKKCVYVKEQLRDNIAKPSKLWKVLKSIGLPSKSSNNADICLKENDVLFFEPKETSNIFKRFYENLAQTLVNKLPPAPNIYNATATKAYYDEMNINSSFKLEQVAVDTIEKLLEKTNANKAPGLDNLSGIFVKDGAKLLSLPLTQIVNLSIVSSLFPDPCKIAKLITLFKKGSKTNPENYRPISLLPLLSKIFEKVVHIQTEKFLKNNNILFKNQSGFRPMHSTESCLTHLNDGILEGCDSGYHTGMILIDLQKAFDTIDHEILLQKLNLMKFSTEAISWFKSYLANRTFLVKVGSALSDPGDLKCGVPQGSILGPLLFLIYINDLPQSVK